MERVDEVRRENRSFGRVEPVERVDKLLLGFPRPREPHLPKTSDKRRVVPHVRGDVSCDVDATVEDVDAFQKTSETARLCAK